MVHAYIELYVPIAHSFTTVTTIYCHEFLAQLYNIYDLHYYYQVAVLVIDYGATLYKTPMQ